MLIDPAGFGGAGSELDMDASFVGQLFVLVSAEYSFLRTDVRSISARILYHPKTHLIYAEDFGLDWGHFGALTSLTSASPTELDERSREIFEAIADGIVMGASPARMSARLNALKVRYAASDGRPSLAWWHEAEEGPTCLMAAL